MYRADLPDDYNFFVIRYCGHRDFPYAHIQLEQATKLVFSHFQEEDHTFIYDILNNKKDTIGLLIFCLQTLKKRI